MTHEELIKPIDSAIWELGEAFHGLPDEAVWVRPHVRLLSIGEITAHVAHAEADYLIGEFNSPLRLPQMRYYPYTLAEPTVLEIGAEALYEEVKRIHGAAKSCFLSERPELTAQHPRREDFTWAYTLEYMAFHIAYHTGQIFSVRHLFGHETTDN